VSATGRGHAFSRAGFIALTVLQFIAVQVAADARGGVLNAKALFWSWMTHKWPQLPRAVRAPLFAVGVSARAVYRAGHYGGRTLAIGVRNGRREGVRRHGEHLRLQRYPKDSAGYFAVKDEIAVDRVERRQGYHDYAEKVHQGAAQERAERRMWSKAATLQDLGEVTAQWAEGRMLFHPGGYDEGPAEETLEIAPALAKLNRAGFVTSGSQPGIGPVVGFDSCMWWQRAAVDGFTDPDTAAKLEKACDATGLILINHGPAGWRTKLETRELVTASFVNEGDGSAPPEVSDAPYYGHTAFGAHLSKRAVKFDFDGYGADALVRAEQVTIIDPIWGRKELLWDVLTEALDPPCCPCRSATRKTP
jgi:hypothetical protein